MIYPFVHPINGDHSGDVALATISDLGGIQPTWTVKGLLRGVHSETVVRSVLWDDTVRLTPFFGLQGSWAANRMVYF